jgi:hypothetical protein
MNNFKTLLSSSEEYLASLEIYHDFCRPAATTAELTKRREGIPHDFSRLLNLPSLYLALPAAGSN